MLELHAILPNSAHTCNVWSEGSHLRSRHHHLWGKGWTIGRGRPSWAVEEGPQRGKIGGCPGDLIRVAATWLDRCLDWCSCLFRQVKSHNWLHLRLIHFFLFPDVLKTVANLRNGVTTPVGPKVWESALSENPRGAARKQGGTTNRFCGILGEHASKLCKSIITPKRISRKGGEKHRVSRRVTLETLS